MACPSGRYAIDPYGIHALLLALVCRSWHTPLAVTPSAHIACLSSGPYVQVMACPSGCLAGGGQLKPQANQTPQQMLEQLEQAYHHQVGCFVCGSLLSAQQSWGGTGWLEVQGLRFQELACHDGWGRRCGPRVDRVPDCWVCWSRVISRS